MKRNHFFMFACCSAFAASVFAGCATPEKPAELIQLESFRNSEEAAQINDTAPDAYNTCTDLTNKSIEAWQNNELSVSKLYAALGQRQYATARAQSSLNEAKAREDAANAEIKELEAKMETLKVKQQGLEKSIALIKKSIADNDMANVENRIQMAMTERAKAEGVEAPLTQKELFNKADAKIKEAQNDNAAGKREEASAAAEEARVLFIEAYDKSKPEFDKKQNAAKAAEMQKALFTDAQTIVGSSYVITDIKSTVIIVAASFDKNKSDILPDKLPVYNQIAALLAKYPNSDVTIEGHVQKSTSNYFEVSQRRCDTVRDYLIGLGVDRSRIMTTAKGKEELRYNEKTKSNRPLNDRVEISITLR